MTILILSTTKSAKNCIFFSVGKQIQFKSKSIVFNERKTASRSIVPKEYKTARGYVLIKEI